MTEEGHILEHAGIQCFDELVNSEKMLDARIQQDFDGLFPPPKAPSPRSEELEKRVEQLTVQFKEETVKLAEKVAQALADARKRITMLWQAIKKLRATSKR